MNRDEIIKLIKELADAKAEIDRLQQYNDATILAKENQRLRATLEKYRSIGAYDKETDAFNDFAAEHALASLDTKVDK